MERFRPLYTKEIEEKRGLKLNDSVDRDIFKFLAVFFLSTGMIPSSNKIEVLQAYGHLTLGQASGGFDALADKVAEQNPKHNAIVKTYWPKEEVEKFKSLMVAGEDYYSTEEWKVVKPEIARWYRNFHYLESESRDIKPPVAERKDYVVANNNPDDNPITLYRKRSNEDFVRTMITIVNPPVDEQTKLQNEKLFKDIFFPTSMIYQVITDNAQYGLECQLAKPTMDKVTETGGNYDKLPLLKKIGSLTSNTWQETKVYADQLKQPKPLTRFGLRNKFTQFVAYVGYATELVKYQIRNSQETRYPQVV